MEKTHSPWELASKLGFGLGEEIGEQCWDSLGIDLVAAVASRPQGRRAKQPKADREEVALQMWDSHWLRLPPVPTNQDPDGRRFAVGGEGWSPSTVNLLGRGV
jgi:hypothetical protein